ncbi:MAG TPA: TldD/PmbA family protein [Thermoanaerobaculia bacterium]|nr:TldD/PmbA family protein [Thermoanaerobaculia bacterium]
MTTKTNDPQNQDMLAVAQSCIAMAKSAGAKEAAARAYRVRDVSLDWRDGKAEKISESTTRGVTIQLYADNRYSSVSTSDLRPEALKRFVADSIALTRALAPDPFRGLPDAKLYEGQAAVDLQLEDPKYASITADDGRKMARLAEEAARSVKGNEALLSVQTSFSTNLADNWMVTSNGFSGSSRGTSFFISANISAKDADGRRPEDFDYAGARFWNELPDAAKVGASAAQRALRRLGAKKAESAAMMVAIDNRAAGRLLGMLAGPLSASQLQQKRSFFEGKMGQQVTSDVMTIIDDPLVPKAFGSRKFDSEGIAAQRRAIIENGVLKNFYVDTYYGRKMQLAPTSGSASNVAWKLGSKSQKELLAEMKDGLLVTSFIGGNSNGGTGDFSVGLVGYRVRNGEIAEPVSEMNVSGNHLEFWKKLVAVGNDPFPYSSLRTPTLVFENVSIAGV